MPILRPMKSMYTGLQFLAHPFRSSRWDAFHSPYLYDLFTFCTDARQQVDGEAMLERQRNVWLSSRDRITGYDLGAGSAMQPAVSVRDIAAHALSKRFQCRFMARLAKWHDPTLVVELGTSLGISAAYLSKGAPSARIMTVEGDPEIAQLAEQFFKSMDLNRIQLYNLSFESYLEEHLPGQARIDLLFLDGHHQSTAITRYYERLRRHLHAGSIIIVDDIYWSRDMTLGWEKLIGMAEVTQSVDCFHFGLLFFHSRFKSKMNHRVRLPLNSYFQ